MAVRNKKKSKKTDQDLAVPWLFYLFFGSIILIMPVFFLSQAMDHTLMPRMLFVSIVLLLCVLFLLINKTFQSFRFSIWREPKRAIQH